MFKRHYMVLLNLIFLGIPFLLHSSEETRPNIIFIMADDLGYGDLGSYGQEKILTPHMDNLAGQGIRFTQAYAGGPVCRSSRSVLMTGLHGGHTPARDNNPHYPSYLQDEDITVAEVLKEAGYRCGGVGKWSLGNPGTAGRPTNQGFDTWFGYLDQDHAHYYYPEYLDDNEGRMELPGNSKTREYYSHDLLTERALKFIRDSKEQPFFLYVAYPLPHYSSKAEDPTRFPVPYDGPYSTRNWSQKEKNYASMITRLDHDVGKITELVETLGLTEETLIIITSDHGPWEPGAVDVFNSNGPFRGYKRDLYEGGIRVPFIARWPGTIPADGVSDEIITFWDMMPTFAELANTRAPERIDGISVVNAFLGRPMLEAHPYLYWDYGHNRETYIQGLRMGDWKGVRIGRGKPIELYYLPADPAEQNNIADQFPEIVNDMEMAMKDAFIPSDRYPVGEIYRGSPIWKRSDHW